MREFEEGIGNPFDTPVPGQSLTDTPGNYPWEHAPLITDPEQATEFIWDRLHKPEFAEQVIAMLDAGIPVEALGRVILFGGFVEGKFNPDVGLLLTPIVAKMVMAIGKKAGVEKIKLGKPKPDETKQLIRTVIRMSPKEQDEMKEVEEDTPTTGLMGKPKEEEE